MDSEIISTKSKILEFLKSSKKQFKFNRYRNNNKIINSYIDNDNDSSIIQDNTSYTSYQDKSSIKSKSISNISNISNISSNIRTEEYTKNIQCLYCNNDNNNQFIILSCNHTFHIKCLANVMNINILIDDEFLNSIYCQECNTKLDSSEILFIYNKFYKETNEYLVNCNNKIKNLEKELNNIKNELKINLEYKQKLEHTKEQSKIIILTLV